MPMGPYPDFNACVKANADKRDPQAYCAVIMRNVEGKGAEHAQAVEVFVQPWPEECAKAGWAAYQVGTERLGLSHDDALAKLSNLPARIGWQQLAGAGWVRQYQAPQTRSVLGVEIFAVGKWTDSGGVEADWPLKKLQAMASAQQVGIPPRIPLKAGHTSDAFNQRLSQALGVPLAIITGDHGQGQIALGEATNFRLSGSKLLADFKDVPAPIADMIELKGGAGFSNVSVELFDTFKAPDGKTYGPVITAVALLGAENPAVESLAGLETALVMSSRARGGRVLAFQRAPEGALVTTEGSGRAEGLVSRLMATLRGWAAEPTHPPEEQEIAKGIQFQREDEMATDKEIRAALGLDDKADVLMEIAKLKITTPPAEFAALNTRMASVEAENKRLVHANRVAHFAALARPWTHLGKKPEAVGEEMATLEEKAGPDTVQVLVSQHDAITAERKRSGLFAQLSTPAEGTGATRTFDDLVNEMVQKEKISWGDAYARVGKANPVLYAEYRASKTVVGSGGNGAGAV